MRRGRDYRHGTQRTVARLGDVSALAMRALLRPLAGRGRFRPAPLPGHRRRLLIVQLDGVSHARLRAALERGLMPELARRLDGGC
jgi:hypothetical protein